MEIEKAIGILKERVRQIQVIVENPTTFYNEKQMEQGIKTMKEGIESSELAIQALEKQIGKKPNADDCCHDCNTYLKDDNGVEGLYCPNCGQKIDWSDADEED